MKFRYYLAISIIFHIIFLFTINSSKNKDKLLGEKFAPIEIVNNQSFKVKVSSYSSTNSFARDILHNIEFFNFP